MNTNQDPKSFMVFQTCGIGIDPIHVGTGGTRLGRVDNMIVRDPVTQIPKIPGSSLAGVYRTYCAMAYENKRDKTRRDTPYFPNCAGQGIVNSQDHCGQSECEICSVFGRASSSGLAGFSDAHVLLFPVATREGPVWITCPTVLQSVKIIKSCNDESYISLTSEFKGPLNFGWIMLNKSEEKAEDTSIIEKMKEFNLPSIIVDKIILVSDKLFSYIVNSNIEVRTSVAIDPKTGAAEDGALFTYEALPRTSVLVWDVICRDPRHFSRNEVLNDIANVHKVIKEAHPFLEALGIGGMGTRGMGRVRVLTTNEITVKECILGGNK